MNKEKNEIAVQNLFKSDLTASELPIMAAGLVHEVKNPLAAIHLQLQLLESYMHEVDDDQLREKMLAKVKMIRNEILSLNNTLQDFVRMIRQEKSQGGTGLDINDLIADIIRLLEPQARNDNIRIELNKSHVNVQRVDPTFIKQITINLILNAIQALAESDRTDRIISISTGMFEKEGFIRISDNGPGISPDVQEKIFQPFYSTREEGSGLGLAIVKKMVSEMGGRMEMETGPGGTSFTVYFGPSRAVIESDGAVENVNT